MRTVDGDHFFFFKQKTAYEMRISDWSSDVCSSDLESTKAGEIAALALGAGVIVPDDLPRLFKLRGSRQTNETPIDRSEERRVGKECVSTCRSRWSPDH